MEDAPTTNPVLSPTEGQAEERPDPLIGQEFLDGQFRILAKIASGGMGAIYLAEQPSLHRRVAVKILHPELARRKDLVQRFHREAKATSRLTHPNTIRTYLYGDLPDRTLYIVMEYLEGANLLQHIRREGPLSIERAVGVVAQIAAALDEAHQAGIIHRDLKSENIFLTTSGGVADYVKILDFGIATLRQGDETQAALTAAGMVFGTPQYMSPEQARGKELDGRSDLYSLGVIFYEALTGQLPWDAKIAMDFITCHLTEPPEPMQKRAPNIQIPKEIEDVVRRLLRKRPEERYRSGAELGRALVAAWGKAAARGALQAKLPAPLTLPVFAGEPPASLSAEIPTSGEPPKRRLWPFLLMLLVLAGAAAGVSYWLQAPAEKAPSATLTIVSSPPDAKLLLNGDPLTGASPYVLRDIPPGTYEVKGEAPNHEPGRSRIQLESGMFGTLEVRLIPIPPKTGKLSVRVHPEEGTISLDGGEKEAGALIGSDILPGEHTLSMEAQGYRPFVTKIELAPDEKKQLEYWLIPESPRLTFEGKPKSATILLFDLDQPEEPPKTFTRTNQIRLPQGDHRYRVEISLDKFETAIYEIKLDPTQLLEPQLSLKVQMREAIPEGETLLVDPEGATPQSRGRALAGGQDVLKMLDRNTSGGVSEEEAKNFPAIIDFKAADTDSDGELDANELTNYGPKSWGATASSVNAAAVAKLLRLYAIKFNEDLFACVGSAAEVLIDFTVAEDGTVSGVHTRTAGFAGHKNGGCLEGIISRRVRFLPPGRILHIAYKIEIFAPEKK